MKTRDAITGFIVLVVLVSGAILIRNARNKKALLPLSTPSIEEKVSQKFGGLTIPSDVEKVELKDVSGGSGFGVATRTEILADLPDLASGKYYQAKLENSQGKAVVLGTLRIAKGGYLLEYNSSKYPGYDKVLVTQGPQTILEGSF